MLGTYAIVAVIAYLLGSIPFGYILVRLIRGEDVRAIGSGNIGATNVMRSGAKGLGILTLVLDAAKGYLAVFLAPSIVTRFGHLQPAAIVSHDGDHLVIGTWVLASTIAALFAILGHIFPVWLKFRGGKGVATGAGAFLALVPKAVLLVLLIFVAVVGISRYVSLGSMLAAAAFPALAYFLSDVRYFPFAVAIIGMCSLLIILKHHANIRRLLAGTEHRFELKRTRA